MSSGAATRIHPIPPYSLPLRPPPAPGPPPPTDHQHPPITHHPPPTNHTDPPTPPPTTSHVLPTWVGGWLAGWLVGGGWVVDGWVGGWVGGWGWWVVGDGLEMCTSHGIRCWFLFNPPAQIKKRHGLHKKHRKVHILEMCTFHVFAELTALLDLVSIREHKSPISKVAALTTLEGPATEARAKA